jgi:hypothetical protein
VRVLVELAAPLQLGPAMKLNCVLTLSLLVACGGSDVEDGSEQAALEHGYGKWEVTISAKVDGFVTPDVVITTCVSPSNPAPGFELTPTEIECEAKSRLKGSKLTWTQECSFEDIVWETTGEAIYTGDEFTGTLTNKENGKLFSTATISGVRLGDC